MIERQDGNGFLEVLPAGDIVGSHRKTYLLAAFDELRGYGYRTEEHPGGAAIRRGEDRHPSVDVRKGQGSGSVPIGIYR